MASSFENKNIEFPENQDTLTISTEPVNQENKPYFNKIWQQTWIHQGYASEENIKNIAGHYSQFDQQAEDYLINIDGQPIGTIRLIKNQKENTLPTLKDFTIKNEFQYLKEDPKLLEITLLAVKEGFQNQGHKISLELMKCYYQFAKNSGFDKAIMAADRRLFKLLQRLGFAMEQIGEGKQYEGSLTIPGLIDLNKTEELLQKNNPKLFNYFTKTERQ